MRRSDKLIVRPSALLSFAKWGFCILFLAGLAFACYRRPIDNLDRCIYESAVRGKSQSVQVVYPIVKHESPRAEESSILDSPQHLLELEPMYTIRPIYLVVIRVVSSVFLMQSAIRFISATALFGIGIIVLVWTKRPLLSCLLVAASPVVSLGRLGGPDALACPLR